jgi:hypothetical protein
MWKNTDCAYNSLSLLRGHRGCAQLLLAMREGAIVAVAPWAMLAAASATLITCEASVLLAQAGLENVGVVENLILGVSKRARETRRAVVFKLDLRIVQDDGANVRAQHRRVPMLARRSSRPLWIMRELALRMPLADSSVKQALTRLRAEAVKHVLILPEVLRQGHA